MTESRSLILSQMYASKFLCFLISDRLLARIIQCAVKRRCVSHRCKSCLGSCRDTPVATKTARRATDWSKLLGQKPTVGGSASRRAATRVKPEQASKVKS